MRTIKDCIWLVLALGFTRIPSTAQRVPPRPQRGLTATQLSAVVDTTLNVCSAKEPVVPRATAQTFSMDSIERTLNGVWRGRVKGNYDKQFLARDGFVNVDYYR